MKTPKISVIIPVYNVEPFLDSCINSILNQTYDNLEIILVDDGSTDSSGIICDKYAKSHKKITIIHKENAGISVARNTALDIATGELIAFIDSDDRIESNYFEILLNSLIEYDADISTCGYKKLNKHCFCSGEKPIEVFQNEEIAEQIYRKKNIGLAPWSKLIRREIIGDLRFMVGRINQDDLFSLQIFQRSNKIIKNNLPLYLYTVNTSGVTYNKYGTRKIDILPISFAKLQIVENTWIDYLPDALYSAACSFIDVHIEYARRKLYNDDIFKNKLLKDREDLYQFFHTHEHLLSDLIKKKINFYYNNTGKIMLCDRIRFAQKSLRCFARKIIKGAKI